MRLWQLYDHHDLVIISIEKPDQSQQNAKGIEPPVHYKVHHQLTIGNLAGYAWNVNKMEIWRDTTYESQNPGFELPKSQWVKPLVIEQLAHSHHMNIFSSTSEPQQAERSLFHTWILQSRLLATYRRSCGCQHIKATKIKEVQRGSIRNNYCSVVTDLAHICRVAAAPRIEHDQDTNCKFRNLEYN